MSPKASAFASSSTARGASRARTGSTTAEADRIAGQAVRIAKASATALRDRVRLDDRPPAHGTYETPVEEDPFEVPLEQKIPLLLAADGAANRAKGVTSPSPATTPAANGRRSPRPTAASPSRRSPTSARASRPTRSRATSTSAGATPTATAARSGGRLRVRPRPRPRGSRRGDRRGGRRAAERAAVPVGPVHDRPRPLAALHADPRELRPPRASSTGSMARRRATPARAS